MNVGLFKVVSRVFFLPFLLGLNNLVYAKTYLQAIGNDSVSSKQVEVKLKLSKSNKGNIYLIRHESSLLDSLIGTGEECYFVFPVSKLKMGDNVLQVIESAPGLFKLSKVTVKVVQDHSESNEAQMRAPKGEPFEKALFYPNPVTSSFMVNRSESFEKVEIYSSSGKICKVAVEKTGPISIEDLPEGIYTIRIFTGQDVKETRLVKQ